MAQQTAQIDLDASPEAVWEMISDFHGIAQWFPGIVSARAEGDVRVLDMSGMEVREQLIESDDDARVLVYSIIEGVPLERHRATITVTPSGGGAHVEWAVEVEPDSMLPMMVDVYTQALGVVGERLS